MTRISIPDPPETVVLDFYKIARRWKADLLTVEAELQQAGTEIIDIPQPPKKGVKLSELLRFEAQRREALASRNARMAEEITRHRQTQNLAQQRANMRKEAADQKVRKALQEEGR